MLCLLQIEHRCLPKVDRKGKKQLSEIELGLSHKTERKTMSVKSETKIMSS